MLGLLGDFNSGSGDDPIGLLAMQLLNNGGGQINPLVLLASLLPDKNATANKQQENASFAAEPTIAASNNSSYGLLNSSPTMSPSAPSLPPLNYSLPSNKQALLQQLKESAAVAYPNNPVMQQVAITQAIQESGLMGRPSKLATKYNNYFGIKAPGTAGTVEMPTFEDYGGKRERINANFGVNNSPADSFAQHRNLLSKPRYQSVLTATNPQDAFTALKRAGYATDTGYINNLNNVYRKYVEPLYYGT